MPLRMGKILLGGKEQENMLRPAGGNGLHEVETRGGASGWWSLKKKSTDGKGIWDLSAGQRSSDRLDLKPTAQPKKDWGACVGKMSKLS